MKVNVKHGLTRCSTGIHYDAIAVGWQLQAGSDLADAHHRHSDCIRIRLGEFVERRDMTSWNHEHMRRRLRIDIVEGNDVLVFEDLARRDLISGDAAEKALNI